MGLCLSSDEYSRLTARRGFLLIRRHAPGAFSHRIIIPDQYRDSRVSASAEIMRVGADCPSWCSVGAQIILAPSYGKTLSLGPRDETIWESVPPSFVQAVVCANTDGEDAEPLPTQRSPEHTFRDIPPADRVADDDWRDEEG
jgi:hypothetical protein